MMLHARSGAQRGAKTAAFRFRKRAASRFDMPLVSVSGACSRSGKTSLAVTLLRALGAGRAAAVKFTTTEDVFERCPRGTPCVVCDIDVPYRVVSDPAVLAQAGTDTDRLGRAGAARVVWAIARTSAVEPAWAEVRRRIADAEVTVMEGSTIVERARPDLRLFVAHPLLSPARWKSTSGPLIATADVVVINRAAGDPRPPSPDVRAALAQHRPAGDVRLADVTEPLASWAPEVLARLERMR